MSGLLVQKEEVYLAVDEPGELNCTINEAVHMSKQLVAWKHDGQWLFPRTRWINNRTVQLKFEVVSYEDDGIYLCGVNTTSEESNNIFKNVTVHVGGMVYCNNPCLIYYVIHALRPVNQLVL